MLIPEMVAQAKKVVMNYDNYDLQVVQKYQVKLVGFPFERIISPAKIYTIGELRTLRDALRSGACCWVRMSRSEVKRHATEIAARKDAGEMVGVARKVRDDKGTKKGPRPKLATVGNGDESSEDDDEDALGISLAQSKLPIPGTGASATTRTQTEVEAGPSKKRKAAPGDQAEVPPKKSRKKPVEDSEQRAAGPSKAKKKVPAKPKTTKKSVKAQLPTSKEIIGSDTDETDPD